MAKKRRQTVYLDEHVEPETKDLLVELSLRAFAGAKSDRRRVMGRSTGIRKRHSRRCLSRDGGRCSCSPVWQASAWDRRHHKRVWRSFPTETAAKTWRRDAEKALEDGRMKAGRAPRLSEVAETWLAGAHAGTIRTRSGERYKPSVLRDYDRSLQKRLLPELGGIRLNDVLRRHVQDLVERMVAEGLSPSTVRNVVMPLRAIYRRAIHRGEVAVNPTADLQLPKVIGKRDRVASPAEAEALIQALPMEDQAFWATAMYAGLRRGELMALRWDDVDLAGGTLRVEHSWDVKEGPVAPKSDAGRRRVPIPAILRDHLVAHKAQNDRNSRLVFARGRDTPVQPNTLVERARRAWHAAKLNGLNLHEARHTFASLMIAAGVNAKALSTFMGHSSIAITMDRYGHLFPGSEAEAAALLDSYLANQQIQAEQSARRAEAVVRVGGDGDYEQRRQPPTTPAVRPLRM